MMKIVRLVNQLTQLVCLSGMHGITSADSWKECHDKCVMVLINSVEVKFIKNMAWWMKFKVFDYDEINSSTKQIVN